MVACMHRLSRLANSVAMSTPSRDLEPLRRYLVAVYRDDRLLSVPHFLIADLLGNLSFVFHEGRRTLPGAAQPKCKASTVGVFI